ncbi:MAG: tyrosine-type recombinase/integrase [Microthrixaceae bacterium]
MDATRVWSSPRRTAARCTRSCTRTGSPGASSKADVPRIRLHDLRHTHATLALAAGIHPKVVSERLGHATVGITLDLYSHVTDSLDKEAAETIAALVPHDAESQLFFHMEPKRADRPGRDQELGNSAL